MKDLFSAIKLSNLKKDTIFQKRKTFKLYYVRMEDDTAYASEDFLAWYNVHFEANAERNRKTCEKNTKYSHHLSKKYS